MNLTAGPWHRAWIQLELTCAYDAQHNTRMHACVIVLAPHSSYTLMLAPRGRKEPRVLAITALEIQKEPQPSMYEIAGAVLIVVAVCIYVVYGVVTGSTFLYALPLRHFHIAFLKDPMSSIFRCDSISPPVLIPHLPINFLLSSSDHPLHSWAISIALPK